MTKSESKKRPYQRTHPWLTFAPDLGNLPFTDWLALGEAAALCDQIAKAPVDPGVAEQIHDLYLAKGALATTAIEGNTLSEREARDAIAGTLSLPPSRKYLAKEIDNVVDACNTFARELHERGAISLTIDRIEWMNGRILQDLEVDGHVEPGKLRSMSVTVGGYRCPDSRDVRFLLQRLCDLLNDFEAPSDNRCAMGIVKAIFAHIYFVWIHPFGDGNGRTARLIEFAILLEAGLPTPACHLPSNHYNLTRTDYYRQLARSSRVEHGIYGFLAYAIAGLVDGLREQIDQIREHQQQTAWINFVHNQFRDATTPTERRRRTLALAVSQAGRALSLRDLPNFDVDTALNYSGLARRTLLRDLETLVERGLLKTGSDGRVQANRERLLAFMPWRHEPRSA